ncbi:MAG: hypothetical protein IAE98_03365 [Candidatus Kapabacteria bacterium]|nr:hypothetical protein [Candidatus Kapabacteria bacterium]
MSTTNMLRKNDLTKIFFIVMIVAMFSSCLNLKKEYPEITYYGLTPDKRLIDSLNTQDVAVLLRNVEVPEAFSVRSIIANVDNKTIQRYFYFRWINDLSYLVTDFVESILIEYKLFGRGVVRNSSITLPDYFLESRIIEMDIRNSTINPDSNFVALSVNFNFFKRTETKEGNKLIFSKTFDHKVKRPNNFAESIPPAVSKSLSVICDYAVAEMSKAIILESVE